MRRSSAGGRPSLGPLRVKNDMGSASKPKLRLSSASSNGFEGRLSTISNNVYNSGRLSFTGGKRSKTRPSITGIPSKVNRRSSMMASGRGYETLKDPRPVSDRGYKDRCMRELVQFLGEHNYPHPISLKILHAPTSKDFYKIFEFLVNFLRPRYTVSKKAEEEIPQLFKQFGYPFMITKSAMITIGSPHSWPTLLAALVWLKRSIEYLCSSDMNRVMYPPRQDSLGFDSEDSQDKLSDAFFADCYRMFMVGEDDFRELDDRFEREYRKNSEAGDCESLMAENRRLTEEVKALKEQPDELSQQKDTMHSLKLDEQRLQQFLKDLEPHVQQCQAQLGKVQNELLAAETELQVVQSEIPRKQRIYETQEFSQNDVKQINAERQQLFRQIAALEGENEAVDRDFWAEEMNMGKAREGVEKTCEKFNRMAQLLQLIPSTAENAFGIDYELRATPSAQDNHKFVSTVKPALTKMKAQCSAKVHESRDRCISEQDTLDQLQEMLDDKNECLAQLDAQIRRAEGLLDCKKEEFKQAVAELQRDHDVQNTQLTELHKVRSIKVQDAEKQLQHDKAQYEQSERERVQQERQMCDFINSVALLVVEHKTQIQEQIAKENTRIQERLKQMQDITLSTEQFVQKSREKLQTVQQEHS